MNPNDGYFVINNLAIEGRVNLVSVKPTQRNINIFADASASFGNYGSKDKTRQNQYAVMAGPAIFLIKHAALEIALKFGSRGKYLYDDPTSDDDREGSFGIIYWISNTL